VTFIYHDTKAWTLLKPRDFHHGWQQENENPHRMLRRNNRTSHEDHPSMTTQKESIHLHANANRMWLVSWGTILLALLRINITEQILKFTFLVHVQYDIRSPDELSFDKYLGKCRPVSVSFDTLLELHITQNISSTDRDTILLEDLNCQCTESTPGSIRITLHVDQDWILLDILSNNVMQRHVRTFACRLEILMCIRISSYSCCTCVSIHVRITTGC